MKIAFAGASGCGKTALARWLSTYIEPAVPMNPVGSRSTASKMGFANPYDVDRASYEKYMHLQSLGHPVEFCAFRSLQLNTVVPEKSMRPSFQGMLAVEKIEWETEHDVFITDRTSLDDLCYAGIHCMTVVTEAFIQRAIEHTLTYDVVFFCPAGVFIDIGQDKARVKDKGYHLVFEAMLLGFLKAAELPVLVPMTSSDLEIRQSTILTVLHRLGLAGPK